jgi:ribonuclease III
MSTPNPKQRERLKLVEASLGYEFKEIELLSLALTHVSFLGAKDPRSLSYQRLEFLGDRILGLAVAQMLYNTYPQAEEGELSRRLSELVRGETCALVADELGLPAALRLGNSEVHTGVRRKMAIIADIMESVLGAVYIDGGLSEAEKIIHTLWHKHMLDPKRPLRDAKTGLQEWGQKQGLPMPIYMELARQGPDHAPVFKIEVSIKGLKPEYGEGVTKRAAEQQAAIRFLKREGAKDYIND